MSDNELDNLFKEAAEGFTPPKDASAWEQMSTMLDKNPVKPGGFWNWKVISGLIATGLIAITTIWFTTTGNELKISKTDKKNEANNATQGVVQEQKEQLNTNSEENFPTPKPLENKSGEPGALSQTVNRKSQSKAWLENSLISIEQKNTYSSTEKSFDKNDASNSEQHADSDNIKTALSSTNQKVIPESLALSDLQSNGNLSSTVAQETSSIIDSVKVATEESKSVKTDSAEHVVDANEKSKQEKIRSTINLKAVVSPDFTSVDYFSAGKTGINYGLLVGYSFNNRWSVYTGVISSKKLYTTKDVEGSYSAGGHDYPMEELDGDCRILDIPLNVYYTFFPQRSFSLRAGLGFSSYIMRKEDYVYCVDNYGKNAYYEQNIRGKNNEWFKLMNISVMVSKRITNRFSAEFEPFVKAPLAGVGEGKVSLVSMGAFINLKYDLIIIK